MTGLYGHKWTSAYGDDPLKTAGREWALTLEDLSREQIDTGLQACRTSGDDWPPSAPAFRTRCFGIPSFEQVRADLHVRSLGFTRLVWQNLDTHLMALSSERDAGRILHEAYHYAIARRLDGAELPAPPAALIEHEKVPIKVASPEVRARARAAFDSAIGRKNVNIEPSAQIDRSDKDGPASDVP